MSSNREYGNLELKYLPPPPELQEGQRVVTEKEFKGLFRRSLMKFMIQNPLIPIGGMTMFGSFGYGVYKTVKGNKFVGTRMMYMTVLGQAMVVVGILIDARRQEKREEAEAVAARTQLFSEVLDK